MTFLITESCIRCKYMNCFEVCPVDCFFEGENMLVINPDECIDCALCEPECPVEAIIPESADDDGKWLELNTKFSEIWPNITTKGKVDTSVSDSYAEEKGKFEKYFSEKEGKG